MVANRIRQPGQRTRLVCLVLYTIALFAISKLALGTWLPPITEKGLWFYAGFVALLLGNLLVTPFFAKPVDALSYSVPGIIGLFAVNPWMSTRYGGFDQFLWTVTLAYLSLIVVAAIGSIALKDSATEWRQKLSRSMYQFSDLLGGPRPVCSAVFLFALVTFHRQSAREYLWIGASWILLIGLRPLETLIELWSRWRAVWGASPIGTRLGEVVAHQLPNIALIQEDHVTPASFGALLLTRRDDGQAGLAMALDHVGFVDGRWLRAIELGAAIPTHATRSHQQLLSAARCGAAFCIEPEADGFELRGRLWAQRERLLGIVATGTRVGEVCIDLARDDLPMRQGSLVELRVGNQDVLYQLIEGFTHEEILQEKNSRGYVQAEAKKIGCWDASKRCFEHVPWLPQPNCPVFLATSEQSQAEKAAVGHFPGTRYPVHLDYNFLVTHNAAILGILGVGKSFLAIELVERMVAEGIKVICLDLTDQYATELSDFHDVKTEQAQFDELQNIGEAGKAKVSKHVEEGGSLNGFAAKVNEHLTAFLDPACEKKLKILNPARFTVWRQDSKPFQNEASMATLTPCEITRIFTEAALAALQKQGMTDKARCCLVYEEAHSLIPEWNAVASEGDKTATNGTAKAILQGRKFGLGCLVITQRTANVTKSILNQCNTVFALRVFDATGMDFLKNYIGEDFAGVLSTLEDRHAVVFGRASSCKDPVLIRLNDRDKFLGVFRQPSPASAPEVGVQA